MTTAASTARATVVRFVALTVVLGAVAALAQDPRWPTDKDRYELMSRHWFIPGCDDIHCFRPLVSWVLGTLPAGVAFKWKAYAVLCEAAAALAMGRLVRRMGASVRTADQVMCLTACGAASLYTLFDPHTSDPLMHWLAPTLVLLLLDTRLVAAGALAAVGILAKEFAAVPLWVLGLTFAWQGRTVLARRVLAMAVGVTALWALWQLGLRLGLGYWNGSGNRSGDFLHGSFIAYWLTALSPSLIVASIAMVFGAMWVLWPAGLVWGGRDLRRLTMAAGPAMLALCVVQQPDRALWNFSFVVMPAVAVVLERTPAVLGWLLVAAQVAANLRVGAQLEFMPASRFGVVLAGVVAVVMVWRARLGEPSRVAFPS